MIVIEVDEEDVTILRVWIWNEPFEKRFARREIALSIAKALAKKLKLRKSARKHRWYTSSRKPLGSV